MRRPFLAQRVLPAAVAALALALAGPWTSGPTVAAAADSPTRTATLVGSLQDELGCPSDWSPDCPDTTLDKTGATTYEKTVTLKAGDYQYKVAINGSWAENYGAGGVANGDNIPLVLTNQARLVFSYDDTTHVISVRPADPQSSADDPSLAGNSLRAPLTRERFYFVMADRFANGDKANDRGGLTGDRTVTGFDPTGKGWYHGGDLAGLTSKLDYIKGLGTTAIWLTPSFKNRPVQGAGANQSAGYHGYWITDFTQVDPHLGTNAQLKTLIAQAHQRGMKVFFDIITNHTADVIDYAQKKYTYISKADAPYKDANGNPFDDRNYLDKPFPPLDPETSFPYTPVFDKPEDATVKVPAWLNDRTLYHNRGDSTYAGENSTYGDFAGLDDLFTENQKVVKGMTDIYKAWVDFGVDGFRIDTVKHVNTEFWQQFAPAIQAEAHRIGNNDFFSFGEVYDANPEYMSTFTTTAKLPATLDFGFQARARAFGAGSEPTDKLRELFLKDDYYTDADSNAYELPTFLGNHDMGRVGSFLEQDLPGASASDLLRRDQLEHALLYLMRGQPVVYYGDEQGFTGDPGGDQNARQDMFASQVASYNDDPMIGTTALGSRDRYDTGAPMYRYIKAMADLVTANPALRDGTQVLRYSSDQAGVFAVSRIDRKEQKEYVVALNNSTAAKTVTLQTYSPHMRFLALWPRLGDGVESDRSGRVTVTVPPLSALVWKANQPLAGRSAAPQIAFTSPEPGGVVGGRAEIGVGADQDAYSQVSFAYRPVGSTAWHPLGTDDNAPYRVFQDVTGMAKGTLLEYRAVLKDSSGNLSAASSYATVGDPPPTDPVVGAVPQPGAVTVAGDLDSELGCPGDWQPDCAAAHLSLGADAIWKGTFTVPAGSYAYKAALNNSWAENYGDGAVRDGPNIPLATSTTGPVTFYYDHRTHWIADSVTSTVATAFGDFQSEMGCAADDDPACMTGWLQDPQHDGTYVLRTTQIPAGSYHVRVAEGVDHSQVYGAGGAPGGAAIPFTVGSSSIVTFSYRPATHLLTVTTAPA